MLVLQALQASIGLISPNMRAVAVERTDGGVVVLHFAVHREEEELKEDIEEMIFDLDAILGGHTSLAAEIHVGETDSDWSGRRGRMIYMAKAFTAD